jgi:hypothetical protein
MIHGYWSLLFTPGILLVVASEVIASPFHAYCSFQMQLCLCQVFGCAEEQINLLFLKTSLYPKGA